MSKVKKNDEMIPEREASAQGARHTCGAAPPRSPPIAPAHSRAP